MLEEEEFKNKSTIDVVGGIFSHVEERLKSFATKSPNSSPKIRAFKRSNTPIYSEKLITPNKNPSKIKNPAIKKRQTIKLENDKIKKLDTFSMKDL